MKNNTKVRLHLSKQLFESLTKEIIKEAKANDGYTVAVKMPKKAKKMEETNQPSSTSTTSVQDMNMGIDGKPAIPGLREKMSSKEKMAKGMYKEVNAVADTDKMKKMEEMELNVAEEGKMEKAKERLHKVMSDIKGLSKEDMHKLHATLSKYLGDKD